MYWTPPRPSSENQIGFHDFRSEAKVLCAKDTDGATSKSRSQPESHREDDTEKRNGCFCSSPLCLLSVFSVTLWLAPFRTEEVSHFPLPVSSTVIHPRE